MYYLCLWSVNRWCVIGSEKFCATWLSTHLLWMSVFLFFFLFLQFLISMFFCLTFHLIPLIGPSPIQYNTNQPRLDPLASSHQRRGTTKSQIPHSRHLASFLFSLYTSLPTQRPLSHLNIYTDTNRHFDGSAQTPARPSPPCSTPPP